MAQTLFPLLVNSPDKRLLMLAEGAHGIILEKNRLKLFEAVQSFLDEAGRSRRSERTLPRGSPPRFAHAPKHRSRVLHLDFKSNSGAVGRAGMKPQGNRARERNCRP
jgi:hypothetical protein